MDCFVLAQESNWIFLKLNVKTKRKADILRKDNWYNLSWLVMTFLVENTDFEVTFAKKQHAKNTRDGIKKN